ncbi:hypothetical protein [Bradyrhizobium sp. JYMT SZCCT0428]|uniref:hypothetical protein n=1 Tax=Bradyrhizobium sp. JYMT SZCCT0428 TaxID=2807673 RepID=UPI001BAE4BE7|nr:hypothetical protein [Bradyrhizobium sp. JYMT SZCCT0428]MBR1154676.1 hypothetical protein [Bradyrhizobium sp. JYMT SZCCT0428]
MNAARTVVLANALSAGGVAAYLARGSDEKPAAAEPVAQLPTTELLVAKSGSIARAPFIAGEPIRSEIILTNIRVLAIDQAPKKKEGMNALVGKAPKRGSSINVVRYSIASQSTAQK